MRIGGFASRAELIKANQVPGSEFRFESMSHQEWMSNARHLSFHGTGRAMDFRAGKNPAFQGAAHEMVSILGGGELSELSSGTTQQRTERQKVALTMPTSSACGTNDAATASKSEDVAMQWGEWAGFSDATHFDYMGPVTDVRSGAQYL